MAIVNFFDTPLSELSEVKVFEKKHTLKQIVESYINDKEDCSQVFEVYNTETGETTYETVIPDGYKVVTIVNGIERTLEYSVNDSDIVTVIFVPQANSTGMDWFAFVGSAIMTALGAILTFASGGAFAEYGIPLMIGGIAGMLTAGITMLTRNDELESARKTDKLDTEKALTITGAENPIIGDNNFPFIFGKIATNPYINGSPYHETFVDANGKLESQYMTALYCLGYGPLKVTDIKIAETILCYNRARDTSGEEDNPTVMHGLIDSKVLATEFEKKVSDEGGYYIYNEDKNAYIIADPQPTDVASFSAGTYYKLNNYIPHKWKNNDVKLEIIQRGLKNEEDISAEEKLGTLYNKTIIEDSVGANLIYIHDEDISAAAEKHYKNVPIAEGFRTNTVRLSQSCPSRIEVELDFSAGVFRSRSEKNGNTSEMKYYNIPVRYAVQWRPIKKNNPVSNAESGEGWRTFDYLKLGDKKSTWVKPKPYTIDNAIIDLSLNAGSSYANSTKYKDSMTKYANEVLRSGWFSENYSKTAADANVNRPYASNSQYYTEEQKEAIAFKNATELTDKQVAEWVDIHDANKIMQIVQYGDTHEQKYLTATYNDNWIGHDVFCIHNEDRVSYTTSYPADPDKFNADERLYVFVKDFTPEEAQEILNSDSDKVEVRVIRITPNYLDQAGTNNENYGDFSYQDLGKWSYLRTFVFDKDAYKLAVDTDPESDPQKFPLRPIRDADLQKFTFVAIRLKQDVAETGGNSLKQMRALVQSFSPYYDKSKKEWLPQGLEKTVKYFQKEKIDDKWIIKKLTKEEYVSKKLAREPYLYKQNGGNNYVQLLADKIFDDKYSTETTPIKKFILSYDKDDVDRPELFNDTNTACSVMLGLVGPQLGDDAKTFEDVNMTSATELYNFCEDVTDGTPDENSEDGLLHIKFSCNGIITAEERLDEVIIKMLITGRSILKRDDENRYEFFIGKPQKYVMNVLNNKNVITKSNTRTFNEIPSGFQTLFPDEDDDYTQNPLYIMDKGEDWRFPSKPMETISIPYVTNRNQLWSLGCFNLAGRIYQRETYSRTVGKFGLAVGIGDVLLIQDDSLLVGTDNGARIVEIIGEYDDVEDSNGNIKQELKKIFGFTTSDAYEYTGAVDDDGRSVQGVTIVQPDKYGASRVVTLRLAPPSGNLMIGPENMFIGPTNIVALEKPIIIDPDGNYTEGYVSDDGDFCTFSIKEGCLVAFGIMTKITEKAQVVGIKPSNGKYTLSLIPYNEDFYNYGKAIPDFTPKMTTPKRDEPEFGFTQYATKTDITESKALGDGNKKDLTINLNVETTIKSCVASRDGISVICETRSKLDSTGESHLVSPMSVTWRFYREDVTNEYSAAKPTSQSDIDSGKYYIKDGGSYIKATVYEDNIQYYLLTVKVFDTLLFEDTSIEQSYTHIFNRDKSIASCNGYPEYYDLYPIKVTATAKLTVTSETSESIFSRVDLTNYGTWIPNVPSVSSIVQDRAVTLSFNQNASQKNIYGVDSIIYEVQIRKVIEEGFESFSKPDVDSSPYARYSSSGELIASNESSYKVFVKSYPKTQTEFNSGEFYIFDEDKMVRDYVRAETFQLGIQYYEIDYTPIESGSTFSQTLPLQGQGQSNSRRTSYEYQIRAKSINGLYSEWTRPVSVDALVTNIRDIVSANATEKNQYVENLSAISANLGEISDGRLGQSNTNYWTLSTRNNPQENIEEHNRDFEGAFRLGDNEEYFICEPQVNNGKITGYRIKFKVGNFEVAANKTDLNNIIYLFDDIDYNDHGTGGNPYHTKRLKLYHRGMEMEINTGTNDDGVWKSVGTVSIDELNNLFITNSDEDDNELPKPGVQIGNASIYHFTRDLLDEYGTNGGNVTFDGRLTHDSSPLLSDASIFSGTLEKLLDKNYFISFLIKGGKTLVGDDFVSLSYGNVTDFNNVDRSNWGNSSLPDKLFKLGGV